MGQQPFTNISSIVRESMTMEALGDRPTRIATGFSQLDSYLGGGLTPRLTILGAGPSSSKSTFAVHSNQVEHNSDSFLCQKRRRKKFFRTRFFRCNL